MHAVIFSGGRLRAGRFTKEALAAADLIIGADSGAKTALEFGVIPTVVVGDFDSLDKASQVILKEAGCQFIVHENEKDETDTELAIAYAIQQQASLISILGGTEGERLDHILANVFLLIDSSVPLKLVNGLMQAWVEKGPVKVHIQGKMHDLLSLLPLTSEVSEVETANLLYPLRHESLYQTQTRGVSNVLTKPKAIISFKIGTMLIVQKDCR